MSSRRVSRRAAKQARQLAIDIVCSGSSEEDNADAGESAKGQPVPRYEKPTRCRSQRSQRGSKKGTKRNQVEEECCLGTEVNDTGCANVDVECQLRSNVHIEGASTPLLSTSAAPQVHGNIGTDNQELHSVLSHHTDTSYGTEFFAELDSLEGRQMHGGSVSRSHALGRPSDSPCDSEFLRKIDEFEQAHISLLPTATPIGKAQVETLDKGLFCGNELQTLGTTQQHIGVEMSRLCELQTPKHGTRYDDQGITGGQGCQSPCSPVQGLIKGDHTSEQAQSSDLLSMKTAAKRASSVGSVASTPSSSFFASLDRHMHTAEEILRARDTRRTMHLSPASLSHSLMATAPLHHTAKGMDSCELLNSAHGTKPVHSTSHEKITDLGKIDSIVETPLPTVHRTQGVFMSMEESTVREPIPRAFPNRPLSEDCADTHHRTNPDCNMAPDMQCFPRSLRAYLPEECCEAFRRAGVKDHLYLWQAECLNCPGVLQGKNVVFCAPTSAGKSLVAEILILRHIVNVGRVCLVVLPFIALCREKSAHLEKLLEPTEKCVQNHFGMEGSRQLFRPSTGVLICTIEKANLLVSRMVEEEVLGSLGMVVVDELHMVGDEQRGYLLELLLTKLRYSTIVSEETAGATVHAGLQIVGMSATMPNGTAIAQWLGAELYETDFRPVPLRQYLKVGRQVKDEQLKCVRELNCDTEWESKDPDHVAYLAKETIDSGHSVLIFCASKRGCEDSAKQLGRLLAVPERFIGDREGALNRAAIVEQLGQIHTGPSCALADMVSKGIAFHHAGLSFEDRELVETAFKCGAVSILTATSTVAAGVNLPARRVIFKDPYIGFKENLLDATRYRQMSGRAGRAGIDTCGESILISNNRVSAAKVVAIMQSSTVPILSCLSEDRRGMKRAVLEVVASGAVKTPEDVQRYIKSTLLAATNDFQEVVAMATRASLKWLSEKEFIRWDESCCWVPTPLGKAAFASSLGPYEALVVKKDLERAREGLVMSTDLHLTFLVSPVEGELHIDWQKFYGVFRALKGPHAKVAALVGVDYSVMQQLAMGTDFRNAPEDSAVTEQIRVAKRFYGALILFDVIQEISLDQITGLYGIARGNIQLLQERSGRFASMVAAFCERMGWMDLEAIVAKFQGRVWRGVRQEILILTEIPHVKAHRARLLYKAGLRTVEAVAAIKSVDQLAAILTRGGLAQGKNPAAQMAMERMAARRIIMGAQGLLVERAQELQVKARAALESLPKGQGQSSAEIQREDNHCQQEDLAKQCAQDHPMKDETSVPAKRRADRGLSEEDQPRKKRDNSSAASIPEKNLTFNTTSKREDCSDLLPTKDTVINIETPRDCYQLGKILLSVPVFGYDFDYGSPSRASATVNTKANLSLPTIGRKPGQTYGTNGDNGRLEALHGIGFAWQGDMYAYLAFREPDLDRKLDVAREILGSSTVEKITHGAKNQMKLLDCIPQCANVVIAAPVIDVRIAAWMKTPDSEEVSDRNSVPGQNNTLLRLLKFAGITSQTDLVSSNLKAKATCVRAMGAMKLFKEFLLPQLKLEQLVEPLVTIEFPLMRVLSKMEAAGVGFDGKICSRQESPLQRRIKELEHQAHELAGKEFLLSSPRDVSRMLFEELGLSPPPSATKHTRKQISTKAEVLQDLSMEHPLPAIILQHRKLSKLLFGFSQHLVKWVVPGENQDLSRLYGSFNQTATGTGRLSMDDPNLQNIPKPIMFEAQVTQTPPDNIPGDRPLQEYSCNIRSAFIAPQGCSIISADYAHLELRIMAHFSQDQGLCRVLCDSNSDPFRMLAAQWQQCNQDEVTITQRNQAKRLAYGLLYGMGPHALAKELETELEIAIEMSTAFQKSLPGVEKWLEFVKESCRHDQYITTLKGRRRYLPEINDSDWATRSHAERQAINSICQGSAADLVKVAMIKLQDALPEGAVMILQIHDELVFEVSNEAVHELAAVLKCIMENAVQLTVPTPIKLHIGSSWGELKELQTA